MNIKILAVALVGAVAAGGYAGWKQARVLELVRIDLSNARSALEKAALEARIAKERAAELAKELDEQKLMLVGLRSERDSAKLLLAAEKTHGERVRAELALAQQQIAYLRARAGVPAQFAPPTLAPQRPMVIQAVPAPRPQGAAAPAQAAPYPR